jgi:hypothetical protein
MMSQIFEGIIFIKLLFIITIFPHPNGRLNLNNIFYSQVLYPYATAKSKHVKFNHLMGTKIFPGVIYVKLLFCQYFLSSQCHVHTFENLSQSRITALPQAKCH